MNIALEEDSRKNRADEPFRELLFCIHVLPQLQFPLAVVMWLACKSLVIRDQLTGAQRRRTGELNANLLPFNSHRAFEKPLFLLSKMFHRLKVTAESEALNRSKCRQYQAASAGCRSTWSQRVCHHVKHCGSYKKRQAQ